MSVLGINHTKIYRVNLVGFKHSAEDPSRSPQKQKQVHFEIKEILKCTHKSSKKFSTNLETIPEAKQLTDRGTSHKRPTLMILHNEVTFRSLLYELTTNHYHRFSKFTAKIFSRMSSRLFSSWNAVKNEF